MSTRMRTLGAALIGFATIAAACGTTSTQAAGSAAPRASTTATPVSALATDEACTARAAAGAVLRATPYRTDDIAAMSLPRSALGTAVAHYGIDWLRYGYMDNVELPRIGIHPNGECTLSRGSGRITGFERAFLGPIQTIGTQVDLFFTAAGAAAWIRGYVAGMKTTPGTQGVGSVTVSSVPALGSGAVKISARCTAGCTWTWVLFRRGALVGTVVNARDAGTTPVVGLTAAARRLSSRMATRTAAVTARAHDPVDAVMALSAGLPRSQLGTKYAGLVWDWFYGGCWDPAEQEASTGDHQARLDAASYGMLTFCRAMYVPPRGRTTLNGVERAYTGGTLYRTATGAHRQFAATVRRTLAQRSAVRFAVPTLGAEAVGLQQRGTSTITRVLFRTGRYLATATLVTRSGTGMVRDVKRWALTLSQRVGALLTTRRV